MRQNETTIIKKFTRAEVAIPSQEELEVIQWLESYYISVLEKNERIKNRTIYAKNLIKYPMFHNVWVFTFLNIFSSLFTAILGTIILRDIGYDAPSIAEITLVATIGTAITSPALREILKCSFNYLDTTGQLKLFNLYSAYIKPIIQIQLEAIVATPIINLICKEKATYYGYIRSASLGSLILFIPTNIAINTSLHIINKLCAIHSDDLNIEPLNISINDEFVSIVEANSELSTLQIEQENIKYI
jgi:hypothetical protein